MPDQYPKMLIVNGQPQLWPDNHPKGGTIIIFKSKADEEAYNASNVTPVPVPARKTENPKQK